MTHDPIEAEALDPAAVVRLQRQRLESLLREVRAANSFYREKFAGCAGAATGDLHDLPFTTRAEIEHDQRQHPPYGRLTTYPLERYVRLHQTSGSSGQPLRWLDTAESWSWWKRCWAAIYRAAGVRAGDRLAYPFSFGPFIGFWSAFESAAELGHLVLPGGGMSTAARVRFMIDHAVTVVCCTPTYALRMAEIAAAEGITLRDSPVRALIVAGEPGGNIPGTRARIEQAWGARVFDHAGMTEMGPWGFECLERPGGLHVLETEFIAEVIDSRGAVLPGGEPGELVLTNLGRTGMPLIRYRTGDQVVLQRGRCPCGRSLAWAEGGVRGRIDDMLIIRGNNVFPSAIESIVREFAEVAEFRLAVEARGELTDLCVEIEPSDAGSPADLCGRVQAALRDRLHFRPEVRLAPAGGLPRFDMKAQRVRRGPPMAERGD